MLVSPFQSQACSLSIVSSHPSLPPVSLSTQRLVTFVAPRASASRPGPPEPPGTTHTDRSSFIIAALTLCLHGASARFANTITIPWSEPFVSSLLHLDYNQYPWTRKAPRTRAPDPQILFSFYDPPVSPFRIHRYPPPAPGRISNFPRLPTVLRVLAQSR